MAVIIKTKNPSGLLSAIRKAIDDKKIETWSYDSDGDFTHTPDQWIRKAWLKPRTNANELQFGFLGRKDITTTKLVYAVYHGRFTEMLLNHFDNDLDEVKATAMPTSIDVVTQIKKQTQ